MYGAILGDIIGSPYEFDSHNIKTKEFELISDRSEFTDDSIMTLAVADAVMTAGRDASDEELKKAYRRLAKENHPDRVHADHRQALSLCRLRHEIQRLAL